VAEYGFVYGRTIALNNYTHAIGGLPDPLAIPGLCNISNIAAATNTVAELRTILNGAYQRGATLHIYGHGIDQADSSAQNGSINTTLLGQMLDEIASDQKKGLCTVMTIPQWYRGLTNPRG
jgi:hypothetical protein